MLARSRLVGDGPTMAIERLYTSSSSFTFKKMTKEKDTGRGKSGDRVIY
jgi:hypothetical protein